MKCDQCDDVFTTISKLNAHKKTHMEVSICKSCNKTCFGKAELARHVRSKHKEVFDDTVKNNGKKSRKTVEPNEYITPDDVHASKRPKLKDNYVDGKQHDNETSEVDEFRITYHDETNLGTTIVLKQEKDQAINFTDDELTEKVRQLLNLLVDDDTLAEFGWPEKSVEDVLSSVIEGCDQVPADYTSCPDYATKIRENTKLLFATVIDTDAIKELLNNQTIDEVIVHVLNTAG